MPIRNYIERPHIPEIRAVFFDGTNAEEVADFMQGTNWYLDTAEGSIIIRFTEPYPGGYSIVYAGFYVFQVDDSNTFTQRIAAEFERDYQPIFNS